MPITATFVCDQCDREFQKRAVVPTSTEREVLMNELCLPISRGERFNWEYEWGNFVLCDNCLRELAAYVLQFSEGKKDEGEEA